MPYFPKAEAPNVQPYWCPLCAAWYLPQAGPYRTSCCVLHPPGSCCHFGETKLIAEGTQPVSIPSVWTGNPADDGSVTISVTSFPPFSGNTHWIDMKDQQ